MNIDQPKCEKPVKLRFPEGYQLNSRANLKPERDTIGQQRRDSKPFARTRRRREEWSEEDADARLGSATPWKETWMLIETDSKQADE